MHKLEKEAHTMADEEYIERNSLLNEVKQVEGVFARPLIIRKIEEAPVEDVVEVKHGKWETVHGVLTPGGDPLKRCPYCKSRESEHLDGVEHPSRWMFCPICGTKMDLEEGATNEH